MTSAKIRKRVRKKSVLTDDVAVKGYIESVSGICINGKHKIKKGERIRTVYLGRYFFDFCLPHWKDFRIQVMRIGANTR